MPPGFPSVLAGAALVFGVSCAVFFLTTRFVLMPPAWRTFEFCQYAEIGRNLALDGRYETGLIEPMALALFDRAHVGTASGRWPVMNRYPLPCYIVAALMCAFGVSDAVAAWSNGLAIGVLAAISYVTAHHWYGPRWAVVAVLFLTNPAFYGQFILLGTPDVWFAVFFVLELLAYTRLLSAESRRACFGWALATGLLGGFAYLARFNMTVFLGVQLVALLWRRRWRDAGVMIAASGALAVPLLVYNWNHFHTPVVPVYSSWNLLADIGAFRVEPWLYYQVPDVVEIVKDHLEGVAGKFAGNFLIVVPVRIWSLYGLYSLMPFALVAWAWRREPAAVRPFAVWANGSLVLQFVVFSALRLELVDRHSPHFGRYFFWYAVPALWLGTASLRALSLRFRGFRYLTAALVLYQLFCFATDWQHLLRWSGRAPNVGRDPIRQVLTRVAGGHVVASNQPQITVWYCGLRSISLPANPRELMALNRNSSTTIDYLLIDTCYNCIQLDGRWGALVNEPPRPPSEWERELLRDYVYVFPPEWTRPVDYVLLRRRATAPSAVESAFHGANASPATRPHEGRASTR